MDFTLSSYKQLISTVQAQSFFFQTFEEFIQNPKEKVLILRHDVDRLPGNSLKMARMENQLGIRATYYFRIIPKTFNPEIIREIADLGHEIGYHYENLTTCGGDLRLSIADFRLNLGKLRKVYPVKTICMHGSPLSRYDNKKIWENFDYRDYGIIADPSFDIDYNELFYITDTGRRWNNSNASVRDKVNSKFDIKIKDTKDLIEKIQNNELPDKIMINVHPQRWNDEFVPWVSELVVQNVKNVIKKWMIRIK